MRHTWLNLILNTIKICEFNVIKKTEKFLPNWYIKLKLICFAFKIYTFLVKLIHRAVELKNVLYLNNNTQQLK